MRKRVALLESALLSDLFVPPGKGNRLERKKRNLLGIIKSEPNDRSNLIVIDPVDQGGHQHDFDARLVQVVNRPHLHIKQVPNLSVTVCVVANSIKLKIHVTQTGLGSLMAEVLTLGKLDSVSRGLHAVVTYLARVFDRFEKVRRDRRLTA